MYDIACRTGGQIIIFCSNYHTCGKLNRGSLRQAGALIDCCLSRKRQTRLLHHLFDSTLCLHTHYTTLPTRTVSPELTVTITILDL
ncbi:hypothetical protein E2C01_053614 [Portunus trituberculatus]|uniref:Uncharacterized protein n=1 Tax=Portunus trituberculatus TaxID=210409 RepID=A0A5B7GH82_PORTR|nr:hypothetical protein [Portunus trituberculatus]